MLSGGVGGAKLVHGFYEILAPGHLTVAVNTGDDFHHCGLLICPDLDTIMYTLSGEADTAQGWGRTGERWTAMEELKRLGGEDWFALGDKDIAVHMYRGGRLASGARLCDVTAELYDAFGVSANVLPMSDSPIPTIVQTKDGQALSFQHYLVRDHCAPDVAGFDYRGADQATAPAALSQALADSTLDAIVIAPSNPFVSISPILSVPGIRAALRAARAPVVAVSPLIGGKAVKGPLAKMLGELGLPVNSASIAAQYADLLDGMVIDSADAGDAAGMSLPVLTVPTLMAGIEDRIALGQPGAGFRRRTRRSQTDDPDPDAHREPAGDRVRRRSRFASGRCRAGGR